MGFINTSEQDVTLLPTLQSLHAVTCCEQNVTYLLPPGHKPAAGSIIQLTLDQKPSATRQTEIVTEVCINKNGYLKDHPQVKGQIICMIHKYADMFTPKPEGKVGVTDLLELELKLTPGPVVRQKPRHLNSKMKESLDTQIGDWLQNGVITESVSKYSSPLVPVRKKDGEVHWCVDFRQVNNWIIADSFPIPHIKELVQKAAGKKLYSALDCFAAYNHGRVHQDFRKYTAFSTPDGHYEYLRMPFGYENCSLSL